ncbi:MAG: thiamine diphosphokinase [Alphaproteobacteria bacterium]|nr:thiamine diphosphokinase [Alphaproteobacteria bacterium]
MLTITTWPDFLAELPPEPLITSDDAVVFVGAGEVDGDQLRHWAAGRRIIALDGGVEHVMAAGLTAAVVVGDMDSITTGGGGDNLVDIPRLMITDQFSTDFEKALAAVKAPLILGFGLLGRRFDHSLAALHAMGGGLPKGKVVLISPDDAVIFSRGEITLSLPPGARLSVWPLTRQRFKSSRGLHWPLDGLTLAAGQVIGTSNRVAAHLDDSKRDGSKRDDGAQQVVITPEQPGDGPGDGPADGMLVMVDPEHAEALIQSR